MSEENHSLNFERLQHAHSRVESARNLRNYASALLEHEKIRERCAEIQTIAMVHCANGEIGKLFGEFTERERSIAKSIASYVSFGRAGV